MRPTITFLNIQLSNSRLFAYLIRFSSSCNIKCVGCKINKNLIGFSLTHITPYNIIKANI